MLRMCEERELPYRHASLTRKCPCTRAWRAVTSVPCPLKPNREHQCYNGYSASHDDPDLCAAARAAAVNFLDVFIAQFGYAPAFLSKVERHIV